MKERIIKLFKTEKKMIAIVALGLVGVLLIVLSEFLPEKQNNNTQEKANSQIDFTTYENSLEEKLKSIIVKINGAGRAEVMITYESSEEYDYAKNYSAEDKIDDGLRQSSTDSEYVIIDSSDGDKCVTLKTYTPKIKGVIVVCDGGDNAVVKNDITKAVSAVFDVGTNNITVLKMNNTEE